MGEFDSLKIYRLEKDTKKILNELYKSLNTDKSKRTQVIEDGVMRTGGKFGSLYSDVSDNDIEDLLEQYEIKDSENPEYKDLARYKVILDRVKEQVLAENDIESKKKLRAKYNELHDQLVEEGFILKYDCRLKEEFNISDLNDCLTKLKEFLNEKFGIPFSQELVIDKVLKFEEVDKEFEKISSWMKNIRERTFWNYYSPFCFVYPQERKIEVGLKVSGTNIPFLGEKFPDNLLGALGLKSSYVKEVFVNEQNVCSIVCEDSVTLSDDYLSKIRENFKNIFNNSGLFCKVYNGYFDTEMLNYIEASYCIKNAKAPDIDFKVYYPEKGGGGDEEQVQTVPEAGDSSMQKDDGSSKSKASESSKEDTNPSKPTSQSVKPSNSGGEDWFNDINKMLRPNIGVINDKTATPSTADFNDVDLDKILGENFGSDGKSSLAAKSKDEEPKAEEPEKKTPETEKTPDEKVVPTPPASTPDNAPKDSSAESETISVEPSEFYNKYLEPLKTELSLTTNIINKFNKLFYGIKSKYKTEGKRLLSEILTDIENNVKIMGRDYESYQKLLLKKFEDLKNEYSTGIKDTDGKFLFQVKDGKFIVKERESAYLVPFINLELECKELVEESKREESKREEFKRQSDGYDYKWKIRELYDQIVNAVSGAKVVNKGDGEESSKSNQGTSLESAGQGNVEVDKDLEKEIDDLTEKYNEVAGKIHMRNISERDVEKGLEGVSKFVSRFQTLKESIYGELDGKIPKELKEFSEKISRKSEETHEKHQSRVGAIINGNKDEVCKYLEKMRKKLDEVSKAKFQKLKNEKEILKGINNDLCKTIKDYNKLAEEHKKFQNINLNNANVEECYSTLRKYKASEGTDTQDTLKAQKEYVKDFVKAEMNAISYEKVTGLDTLVDCLRKCGAAICNFIKAFDPDYANSVDRLMDIRIAEVAKSYRSGDEKGDLSARFSTALSSISSNVKKLHEAQKKLSDGKLDYSSQSKNSNDTNAVLSDLKLKFTVLNNKYVKLVDNHEDFFKEKNKNDEIKTFKVGDHYRIMQGTADREQFLYSESGYVIAVVKCLGSKTEDRYREKCTSILNDFQKPEADQNECLIRMYELAVRAVRHLKNKIVKEELAKKKKGFSGKIKGLLPFKKKKKNEITKEGNETSINAQEIEKCFEKVGIYFVKSKKFTRKDMKSKLKDVKKILGKGNKWYKNLEVCLNKINAAMLEESFDLEVKLSEDDKRKASIAILLASLYELGDNEYIIGACDGLKKGGLRGTFDNDSRKYFGNAAKIRKGIKNAAVIGGSDLSRVKNYMNSSACKDELEGLIRLQSVKQCIEVFKTSGNEQPKPSN